MMSQSIFKLEIPSNQSFGMTLSNSKTEFLNFSKKNRLSIRISNRYKLYFL